MTFRQGFAHNRGALAGLAVLIGVVVLAAAAPVLFPFDPWDSRGAPLLPPGGAFAFGTDMLGRDVIAGIFHGARVSLFIGVVSTLFAVALGVVIGAVSGYFGGAVDDVLMRFTELFQTVPSFVLAVLLVAILTPGLASIVLAIAVVTWPPVARLARSEFLTLRHREFVEAAVLSGVSTPRIILVELLPNALTPIVIMASLMVATAILTESALSFLGLAIFLTVLAINLVGEGLTDALNPHLRRRGATP